MSRLSFTEALDQALELLDQGHPLEYCVRQFPEYSDELRPLLQVSADLYSLATVSLASLETPSREPDWEAILSRTRQEPERRFKPFAVALRELFESLRYHPVQRFAALGAAMVILGFVMWHGTDHSSADSVLYPIKRGVEQVEFIAAQTEEDRLSLQIQFAHRRLAEVRSLAYHQERVEPPVIHALLQEAHAAIVQVKQDGVSQPEAYPQINDLWAETNASLEQLKQLAAAAPAEDAATLESAVSMMTMLRADVAAVAVAIPASPTPVDAVIAQVSIAPTPITPTPTRAAAGTTAVGPTPAAADLPAGGDDDPDDVSNAGATVGRLAPSASATPTQDAPTASPAPAPMTLVGNPTAPAPAPATSAPAPTTENPTIVPTEAGTEEPTISVTIEPTAVATELPSAEPVVEATPEPTVAEPVAETPEPTRAPKPAKPVPAKPMPEPVTATPEPTAESTETPTATLPSPTGEPAETPTASLPSPTGEPAETPTASPTALPSEPTAGSPTEMPTETAPVITPEPTLASAPDTATAAPIEAPTLVPTEAPTVDAPQPDEIPVPTIGVIRTPVTPASPAPDPSVATETPTVTVIPTPDPMPEPIESVPQADEETDSPSEQPTPTPVANRDSQVSPAAQLHTDQQLRQDAPAAFAPDVESDGHRLLVQGGVPRSGQEQAPAAVNMDGKRTSAEAAPRQERLQRVNGKT